MDVCRNTFRRLLEPHGTAARLAKHLGVATATVSQWKSGAKGAIPASHIPKIAAFFDVPVEYLCDPAQNDIHSGETAEIVLLIKVMRNLPDTAVKEVLAYAINLELKYMRAVSNEQDKNA